MNELNTIIKREYDLFSELEITHTAEKKAMEIIKERLSQEDYAKVDDVISDYIINVETSAFQQGFIRGIAVAKGGAL